MKYLSSFLAFLIVLNISCASAATEVSVQQIKARKVKRSFAIKAPVSEMYDFWITKLYLMSTVCPDQISSVDLVEGIWGKEGSVILWKYDYRGKASVTKEMIEVIDREKNRSVYRTTEGGPLEEYKSFTWIYETSPNEKAVRWTLEYETDNEDVPKPIGYLDLLSVMMERIDAYLITGA